MGLPIPTPISTKEKEWGHEKQRSVIPETRRSNKREETEGKLKESKLMKLNYVNLN